MPRFIPSYHPANTFCLRSKESILCIHLCDPVYHLCPDQVQFYNFYFLRLFVFCTKPSILHAYMVFEYIQSLQIQADFPLVSVKCSAFEDWGLVNECLASVRNVFGLGSIFAYPKEFQNGQVVPFFFYYYLNIRIKRQQCRL